MKTESESYFPLVTGALLDGWFLYRIADGSPGRKPFDVGGVAPDGRGVGLEVKLIRVQFDPRGRLPWRLFATHQVAWLQAFAKVNAYALVGLWYQERMMIYRLDDDVAFDRPAIELPQFVLTRHGRGFRGWWQVLRV